MIIKLYPEKEAWPFLFRRPVSDKPGTEKIVRDILERVRSGKDAALMNFTREFDGVIVENPAVSVKEIAESGRYVAEDLKSAIRVAKNNIEKFHRAQIKKERSVETFPGVKCWRKSVPVENVGIYIPGGTAPLFSTVLMLAIPARIAGCSRIIMCSPPSAEGKINPVILYAAHISGITDIFIAGGAQAIGAMAYGTETIPKVDKIFGPGNIFVTKAKELVQAEGIAIDMPAGPSELLVIADKTADPAFVASDLLSQAEHGTDSQVVFLTDNSDILYSVQEELSRQLNVLPRRKIAEESLKKSLSVLLPSIDDCILFSNDYAPEHLVISTSSPMKHAEKIINAGSVFLGNFSCESAGDYATGTNHTLPTNGYARNYSGVSAESYMKKISFQEVRPEGLKKLGPFIEIMAEAENLSGHKNAVALRLKYLEK